MKFSKLAEYLQKLENTTKRLEMTSILKDLLNELDAGETDLAIYLSLGYLKAQYESEKFNIAEKMMIRVLENTFKNKEVGKLLGQYGDLGDVAYELGFEKKEKDPEICEVHQKLLEVARIEGTGSQDSKVSKLSQLISSMDKISAKYTVRIVLGTTRLGFTELTLIDALSQLSAGDKSLKKKIESKYFIHPDIGLIAKIVKKDGVRGLEKIKADTGVPILVQKAQRAGGIEDAMEKIKDCWAEFKFDGTRVQLHLDRNKKEKSTIEQNELFTTSDKIDFLVRTYTRNLEDSTHQFPDIVQAAGLQLDAQSAILDGEAMGVDKKTGEFLPFQQIMQRKRKHSVKEMSEEIPVRFFAFDLLYLNGESQMEKSLKERSALLKKVVKEGEIIKTAEHFETSNIDELVQYFEKAKDLNLEGLIVKNPSKPYEAGARSFSWIKLKKADEKLMKDSVDAVVLGYYLGRGERSKFGIGGFLIGVYDEKKDKYVTISKVGTGLKDEDWSFLKKEADKHKIKQIPSNVEITQPYIPDVITEPKIVVEIGADEVSISKTHSAGMALRFPRLLYFRTDKSPNQITTLNEIIKLHSMQKRGRYETSGKEVH